MTYDLRAPHEGGTGRAVTHNHVNGTAYVLASTIPTHSRWHSILVHRVKEIIEDGRGTIICTCPQACDLINFSIIYDIMRTCYTPFCSSHRLSHV
jgi:hypothetical protein